jgi:DNA-directed RNA polymerase specialized sigma24 family protein
VVTTKSKGEHYVSNSDLLAEVIKFKDEGKMSEDLGKMLLMISTHYSTKSNFSGYTWKQDMISESVFTCVKYLKNFKPEKSTNAFAYVTQIIKNSFKLYITDQKKHSKIKDVCYRGYEMYQSDNRDNNHYTQKSLDYENILSFVDENVKVKEDVGLEKNEVFDNE